MGMTMTSHNQLIPMQIIRLLCLLAVAGLVVSCGTTKQALPEKELALFNGKDLSGWYGWGTQDPTDLWKMSDAERAEYKKKSVEGGVKDAKGNDKVGIVGVGPVVGDLEIRRQQRERLPVHVVDHRRGEEHGDNPPA